MEISPDPFFHHNKEKQKKQSGYARLVCMYACTVPLNYNFTFTRIFTSGATRGSRGKCQKLPWKASFPRDGPWLFHAKTHGISRHVAFPRDDTWHFHETSRGISTRPVTVESHVEFSRDQ